MVQQEKNTVYERTKCIQERIVNACIRLGRPVESVILLPVTKTCLIANTLQTLKNLGLARFGESRTKEIFRKSQELSKLQLEWVMIGHVQRNKVKHIGKQITEIQSVDDLGLAYALDNYLKLKNRIIKILVQVKTSNEENKHGIPSEQLIPFLENLSKNCSSLRVEGLMTIAEHTLNLNDRRICFEKLYALSEYANTQNIPGINLDRLSMGMSDDFEIAIAEGSTEVRIGRAIFSN